MLIFVEYSPMKYCHFELLFVNLVIVTMVPFVVVFIFKMFPLQACPPEKVQWQVSRGLLYFQEEQRVV